MRFIFVLTLWLAFVGLGGAEVGTNADEPATPVKEPKGHPRPALIATADLKGFDQLSIKRQTLIRLAIKVATEEPWLPYKFGGSTPRDGGFDCSGAIHYVLGAAGLKPPRTSAAQYQWLADRDELRKVPEGVTDLDHASLAKLQPGDLLFWFGTYVPTDSRTVNITHVAIYLGREKKDDRAVMINATDGRSYRGRQANGYGVYDFRLPRKEARASFAGYGTPPGLE